CADNPNTVAVQEANCPDNAMLTEPGTCALAKSSPERTSSASSPSSSMVVCSDGEIARSGGKSDNVVAPVRLISASFAKYSGRVGKLLVNCAVNSSRLLNCSA